MPIPSPSLTGSLFPFSRAAGATNTLPSGPNINQTVFGPQSPAPKSFFTSLACTTDIFHFRPDCSSRNPKDLAAAIGKTTDSSWVAKFRAGHKTI